MSAARVLVIDDTEEARNHLAGFFRARAVQCEEASNNREAIALLSEKNFDLVFLDLNLDMGLGEGDGVGVLSWMAANGKCIPTVIVSATAHHETAIRASLEYPFVRLRLKPGQVIELADIIDRVLRKELGIDESSLFARIVTAVAAATLSWLSAYILYGLVAHEMPSFRIYIGALIVFTTVSGVVHIFGISVALMAAKIIQGWHKGAWNSR